MQSKLKSQVLVLVAVAAIGMIESNRAIAANDGTFSVSNFSKDTDLVVTGGTVIAAANCGGKSNRDVTVNGLRHVASNSNLQNIEFSGPYAETNFGALSQDAKTLNQQVAGTARMVKLKTKDLTEGKEYLLQIYYATQKTGQTIQVHAIQHPSGMFRRSPPSLRQSSGALFTTSKGDLPRIISYRWKAKTNSLNVLLSSKGYENNSFLSGYSIQEIVSQRGLTIWCNQALRCQAG